MSRYLKSTQLAKVIITTILFAFSMHQTIVAKDITIEFAAQDKLSKRALQHLDVKAFTLTDTTEVKTSMFYSMNVGVASVTLPRGAAYMLQIIPMKFIIHKENGNTRTEVARDNSLTEEILTIDLSNVPETETTKNIGTVYFSKWKPKELETVTVTASKIMFYHKGDTLMYNADAFMLAEGSMLDALLEQLPGVEIRNNGVIYAQGRRIDNLLLNGKDLFNGNNELMLENLPAYTVKDIRVYQKTGHLSDLMGEKMAGDSRRVMDVKLKREYSMGWFVNAEAGAGTNDRYLGRLFGMWFSDNVSMTTYANFNNLTDNGKPGQSDNAWSRDNMGTGVQSNKKGGLTYNAQGPANRWMLLGDVDVHHTDEDIDLSTMRKNYFTTGDTYEYGWQNSRNKTLKVSTDHKWFTKLGERASIYVLPNVTYEKFDRMAQSVEASFSSEMKELSRQRIIDIYSGGSNLADTLINRSLQERLLKGNSLKATINTRTSLRLKSTGQKNMLSIHLGGAYDKLTEDRFNRYAINYGNNSTPASEAYQYQRNHPDRDVEGSAKMEFTQLLSHHRSQLPIYYEFRHVDEKKTSNLYRLDQMAGFGQWDSPIGTLPSLTEYLPTYDDAQSYHSRLYDDSHNVGIRYLNTIMYQVLKSYFMLVDAHVNVSASNRRYEYHRAGKVSKFDRTDIMPGYSVMLSLTNNKKGNYRSAALTLKGTPIKSSLINMVDMPETDPLNIYLGNPDLKNAYAFDFGFDFNATKRSNMHTFKAKGRVVTNAMARGYIYDRNSGVRTFRTYNVNGNYDINSSYEFFRPFGKNKKFDLRTTTKGHYRHSVDLSGSSTVDFDKIPPRRSVNTFTFSEGLKLNFKTGKHRISANGEIDLNRYTSSDEGFTDFTSWTAQYGASGVLNLPRNWGLSTDLTLYTRRGFTDRQLNTTDLVWNARATKSILNGSVVFVVDAYDLLRQLTNVTYTINAQARTETVSNVIPAYVLFHIQYRWNKQPKR